MSNWVDTIVYEALIGQTIIAIDGAQPESERIEFTLANGDTWIMQHIQDCCENVQVEDVSGDINDLLGSPLLMAEEVAKEASGPDYYESATWTFYKFATEKGHVTLRWIGESNGYYSERVDFSKDGRVW